MPPSVSLLAIAPVLRDAEPKPPEPSEGTGPPAAIPALTAPIPGPAAPIPGPTAPIPRPTAPIPELTAPIPAPAAKAPAAGPGSSRRFEWSTIVFGQGEHGGEFLVVAVQSEGTRRVVARSQSFRVPLTYRVSWLGAIPHRGKPRRAYEALVKRLTDSDWRQMETRGRWHDTAFLRPLAGGEQSSPVHDGRDPDSEALTPAHGNS